MILIIITVESLRREENEDIKVVIKDGLITTLKF
jgi:hypothetical protein